MNKDLYQHIILSAPFGFAYHQIITDDKNIPIDYRFIEVNPAFEKLTGLKAADIISKTVLEVIPGLKDAEFDWISFYGEIALNGGEKTFEQYSEPLGKWFKVQVHSPLKTYFTTIFTDISHEKNQNDELTGFFNVNLDLLCIADLEGHFIKVNKEWEYILGYSVEELQHRKFLEFVHPDDMQSTLEVMGSLGKQESVLNFVNRYLCKDGTYRFIEWRSHPHGNLIYAAARDITERYIMEHDLLASETKFRAYMENAPLAVFVSDYQGNFVEVNPQACNITGYSKDQILQIKISDLIDVDSRDKAYLHFQETISKGKAYGIYKAKKKDGTPFWLSVNSSKINDKLLIAYCDDVTDDIHLKEKLKEKTEQFELAINGSNDGIWDWNILDNTLFLSSRWKEMLGYQDDELKNEFSSFESLLCEVDKPYVLDYVDRYLKGDTDKYDLEFRMKHKNGEMIWIHAKGQALRNQDGIPYRMAGSQTDITKRKITEEALKKSEEQLKLTLEVTGDGIWDWDLVHNKVEHNSRWCQILGLDASKKVHDLEFFISCIHPEDRELIYKKVQETLKNGIKYDSEHRMLKSDGKVVWVHDRGAVVQYDDAHQPVRMLGSITDITERKLYETALRESEERLKTFFTQSHAGIFFMMLDEPVEWNQRTDKEKTLDYIFSHQRMVKVNKAMLEQYHTEEKDFIGLTPNDFFAHDIAYGKEIWRTFFDQGHYHFETNERAFDGSQLWVMGDYVCLYDEKGRITGHFGIQSDITERRVMEEKLANNEKNFRNFFETLDDLIFIADKEGKIYHTNSAVSKKLGFTDEELQQMHVLDVHPIDKRDEATDIFTRMFKGELGVCPLPLQKKNGEYMPVETRVWFGNWDGMDCIFGVSKDISKEQEALQMFNKLFNSNPALMALTSIETGKYLEVNDAFLKTLGYTRDEVIGHSAKELDITADPDKKDLYASELKEKGFLRNRELKVKTKDKQELYGLFSGELIENQGKKYFLTVMTDISVLKKVENELKIAKDEAESANKAKSEFLANMSHEIRTPLNGVIGFTDLLLQTPLTDTQKLYAKNAGTSGKALLGIINDILDFSKIEAGKLELDVVKTNLFNLLEETIDIVRYQANEKDLELILDIQADMPENAMFDPVRLKQIIINLLNNAVKFTEKGEIILKVIFKPLNEYVGKYDFTVSDTGIGIKEEQLSKLFKAFSQADSSTTRKFGGTGLGLIISEKLAEKMNSKIDISSEFGKGSVFEFTIETGYQKNMQEEDASPIVYHHCLVIDDNPQAGNILKANLISAGLKSSYAENGVEAFKILDHEPLIDLLIIDKEMPYIDGVDLIKKLRFSNSERYQKIEIILLKSINDSSENLNLEARFKPVQIMRKPLKIRKLLHLLKSQNEQIIEDTQILQKETASQTLFEKTILIAEDVKMNMILIKTMLTHLYPNARILEAQNGQEVLQLLKKESIDLIFMDVQMPVMDGIEVTQQIRQEESISEKHIPIIALTAGALKEEQFRCINAGMDAFVTKPVQEETIRHITDQYLMRYDL
nr:PAS domain S-box protein [Candidatus Cloacimonadota bacterium]